MPRSARRGGTVETSETRVVVLITQRSEVQILPRLPISAGQRPIARDGGRVFDLQGSVVAAGSGPEKPTGGSLGVSDEVTAFRWADESQIAELADQAHAIRVLDAMHHDQAPAIRAHDGVHLLASSVSQPWDGSHALAAPRSQS
jgi:hypothetical protein